MTAQSRALRALLAASMLSLAAPSLSQPTPAAETIASVDERGVAMPQTWLQFRLNGEHNPVIDAPMSPAWELETHGQISASPAVVNGMIYIGTNGGLLYAIDASSGLVRWKYRARNGLKSNPLVQRGVVIVGEGNADSTTIAPRRRVRVGSGSSGIVALDATTGRQRWYYPLSGTGQPTATIVDGLLVHHDGDGVIVALDPRSGSLVYRHRVHTVASMVGAVPVGSDLVVTTGIFPNRVIGFSLSTGAVAWTWELPSTDSGVGDCPPATDGRDVFCNYLAPVPNGPPVDPGRRGVQKVYSLDTKTGRPRWIIALEEGVVPPRNEAAIPLLYRNRLFVGSAVAPYMHAIDAKTGKVLWRRKVHAPVKGGLVARNGRLYFGDLQGYLWALDAATGRVVGTRKTTTAFNVGSPVIVGGSLVIGSNSGRVVAIPLAGIETAKDT